MSPIGGLQHDWTGRAPTPRLSTPSRWALQRAQNVAPTGSRHLRQDRTQTGSIHPCAVTQEKVRRFHRRASPSVCTTSSSSASEKSLWDLAPQHSLGCRVSSGPVPPPLWIRYVIVGTFTVYTCGCGASIGCRERKHILFVPKTPFRHHALACPAPHCYNAQQGGA